MMPNQTHPRDHQFLTNLTPAAIRRLLYESSPQVRLWFVQYLGSMLSESLLSGTLLTQACEELRSVAKRDPKPDVCAAAAEALAGIAAADEHQRILTN